MALFLVTLKVPPHPEHNPTAKVQGKCPVGPGLCSDVTGAHHTVLVEATFIAQVEERFKDEHITRIELGVVTNLERG